MKADGLTWQDKSPCTAKIVPVSELLICPECRAEIELWSDEEEAACRECGSRIQKTAAL